MARRRLTQRQRDRIESIQVRRRRQLEQRAETAMEATADQQVQLQEGRVLARYGQNLAVADLGGTLHYCLSRQNIGNPVCGDRVAWQPTGEGSGVVTAVLERTTLLSRPTYSSTEKPLAANISQLVIVLADQPAPSRYLLDQYLVAAEQLGIRALIAFNKSDRLDDRDWAGIKRDFGHYIGIGYPLIRTSARFEHGLDTLVKALSGQTSILVGQSGVGKSSLVNALLPDISIQVGRLSEASGTGRHTTSSTTLYRLPQGGELIDSPGVRSFRLTQLDQAGLEQGFKEFRPFIGHCRYSNCSHEHEPGCALVDALAQGRLNADRLANFLHMAKQLQAGQPR